MPPENSEWLREQLRIKDHELRKRNAEREKLEGKVNQLNARHKRVVNGLREQIETQTATLAAWQKKVLELENRERQEAADMKAPSAPSNQTGAATDAKSLLDTLDPRVIEAINQLRSRNQKLLARVEEETKKAGELRRTKKILVDEIHRLRDQPEILQLYKNKIRETEDEFKKNLLEYETAIREKNRIINSFKGVLYKNFGDLGSGGELPEEILRQLSRELDTLKTQKEELAQHILNEKKIFGQRLADEINQLEKEWEGKVKKIRRSGKISASITADVIMGEEAGAPLWMITFADMTTLLLTFFILYYSISAMNMNKFKEAILGDKDASIGMLELLDSLEISKRLADLSGLKSKDILSELNQVAEKSDSESPLSVATDKSRIIVQVPGEALFKPGEADLQLTAREVLDSVIKVIRNFPEYKINIRGHTDNVPIATERFPTNWELSASRATAVLRYFIDKNLEPSRITATGFADLFPIASNESELGRAKNRRVEIVLEKEK